MLDNMTVLETATKFFQKYGLPDGFHSLDGRSTENLVHVIYRLGEWDVPEMEMICESLNTLKKGTGGYWVVAHEEEIDGVPVRLFASIPYEAYIA